MKQHLAALRFKAITWKRQSCSKRLLSRSRIVQLTPEDIKEVADNLNCFGVHPLAKSRFLKFKDNSVSEIQSAWFDLLHGSDEVKLRMNNCKSELFGFGKSAIQELLGYYDPDKYPLRNANVNSGLRFLGYDIND